MNKYCTLFLVICMALSCKNDVTKSNVVNAKIVTDTVSFFKQKGVSFDNNITDFDPSPDVELTLQDLEKLKLLPQLTYVRIPKGQDDRVLDIIKMLENIELLSLRASNITDFGLVKISNLNKLSDINLSETKITDVGLRVIKSFQRLERINLDSTRITDEGLKNLIGLSKLYEISLNKTAITDKGLMYLSVLKGLRAISLRGTKVTLEGVKKFEKEVPGITEIGFDY